MIEFDILSRKCDITLRFKGQFQCLETTVQGFERSVRREVFAVTGGVEQRETGQTVFV